MKLAVGTPFRLARYLQTSRVPHNFRLLQARTLARSDPESFATPLATSPRQKPLPSFTFQYSTTSARTTTSHSNMATDISTVLTPACLKDIRDFWFEHIPHEDESFVPVKTTNMRWWAGGEEFDNACGERFKPILEAVKASGIPSGEDLLDVVSPQEPRDWLSLILLLDQLPRNCYRDASSAVVFSVFDPLSEEVAQAAIAAGIPDEEPEVRWRFGYRLWFYMPLMHSEKLAVHELALRKFEQLAEDVETLIDDEPKDHESEYKARAREVVRKDAEAAKGFVDLQLDFEKRHQVVIQRFGRYPHRNEVLGRESTAEEKQYLADGGETFAASKEQRDVV